jgi:hypothetical protein
MKRDLTTASEITKTFIWQRTLGKREKDSQEGARTRLREAFVRLREKVTWLVSLIVRDMPDYTLHDISHLEALWEIIDTLVDRQYPLNPAEAFVLGGAILLHDAGMCLAAYPGGMREIIVTPQWRDAVATLLSADGKDPTPEAIMSPPENIKKAALQQALRLLHSRKAHDLPTRRWRNSDTGEEYYLLADDDIRTHYGPLIGQIAESHWWNIKDLEKLAPKQLTAMAALPTDWTVDPVKVACLLRVGDAAHIDQRRAPRFLQGLLQLDGAAGKHWSFQAKIGKPVRSGDALIYSSGQPFALHEYESWWLCFQMLAMIDRELRLVDVLLEETHRPRLAVRGVKGAESPEATKQYLPTAGWEPLDTQLHISNVAKVVEMLGGKQLYGDRPWVAVRELVQNAADAVRARRILERRTDTWGEIEVTVDRQDGDHWLHIADNGVGMSPRIITEALLDFGRSFWRSSLAAEEFPGLQGSGVKATGRFGIGFFSVFMLGDYVRVISRRYDWSANESHVLEFRNGLKSPPLLRFATTEERQYVRDGGTRISVRLKEEPYSETGFLGRLKPKKTPLSAMLSHLCPALDVNLVSTDGKKRNIIITAGDWTKVPLTELCRRINPHHGSGSRTQGYAHFARLVKDKEGRLFGRAWINPGSRYEPCGEVTIGGLLGGMLNFLGGIWLAETALTVRRDDARPSVTVQALQAWAREQAQIIARSNLTHHEQLECAEIILACGVEPEELPICINAGEYLNCAILKKRIAEMSKILILSDTKITHDDDWDSVPKWEFESSFKLASDSRLFLVKGEKLDFLSDRWPLESSVRFFFPSRGSCGWPYDLPDYPGEHPYTPENLLWKLVEEVWRKFDVDRNVDQVVGEVNGVDISRLVDVVKRLDGKE